MIHKLMEIQNELNVPKNQRNTFGNYNYRSCEDILEAVKPLCKKNNVAITISDEIIEISDRFYLKATATLWDCDSEKTISNTAYAREEETKKGMDSSQITGSTSSYARKYALNGLFAIDDTKDADTQENSDKKHTTANTTQKKGVLSENQIKRLYAIGNSIGYDKKFVDESIARKYNKTANDLTRQEYDEVCKLLENGKGE